MNKTEAKRLTRQQARYGFFAVGGMEAELRCPVCSEYIRGYLTCYAGTYSSGQDFKDRMVDHLMEEH